MKELTVQVYTGHDVKPLSPTEAILVLQHVLEDAGARIGVSPGSKPSQPVYLNSSYGMTGRAERHTIVIQEENR
jgi:hypothetical protein